MSEDAPPPVNPPPAPAPPPTRRDDMRAIATAPTTFIGSEPSHLTSFFHKEKLITDKFAIAGYDNYIDDEERMMLKSEFIDAICMVAPLDAKDRNDFVTRVWPIVEELYWEVDDLDVELQIPRLRAELTYWIRATRFGLPSESPEESIARTETELFAKAMRRLEDERAKRYLVR